MRKAILLILAVVSSSALAEWAQVSTGKAETHYADPATILKVGNKVKMSDMTDTVANGKPFSVEALREYDCKENQVRILTLSGHRGKMGGGDVVFNNTDPDPWGAVPSDSATERLFRVACEKR